LDEPDGREWYRLIDYLMRLPEEMNKQVHEQLFRQHTEEPMKYVSFAERQGIEKGFEKGEVIGRIHMCQEMLKQPETPKEELSALSQEDLSALLAQLRKQFMLNDR
jgi:hypothetical protein